MAAMQTSPGRTVTARRAAENPIITPADVRPSRPDMQVVGAFNPAAIRHDGETILLLRVAEAPRDVPAHEVAAPVWDPGAGELRVHRWRRDRAGVDTSDPRITVVDGRSWLTSTVSPARRRTVDVATMPTVDAPPRSSFRARPMK